MNAPDMINALVAAVGRDRAHEIVDAFCDELTPVEAYALSLDREFWGDAPNDDS